MKGFELKLLPVALIVCSTFSPVAFGQNFSMTYDWNQDQDYQYWWSNMQAFGPESSEIIFMDSDRIEPTGNLQSARQSLIKQLFNCSKSPMLSWTFRLIAKCISPIHLKSQITILAIGLSQRPGIKNIKLKTG